MNPSRSVGAAEAAVLDAENLHKRYGRKQVLRGASLRVHPGELVAVLGENGAGKSTLLRLLAGTEAPDRGVVRHRGTVSYCPQEAVLYGQLTLEEHFRLFGAAYRLSTADLRTRGEALIDRFGLERHRRTPVEALSGGTRQKLNLAVALLRDPDVLLLDEPYSGFDREAYGQFMSWTDEAKRRGQGVVLITHLLLEQGRFDLALQLREGALEEADG
jgi:ABC-2 type transport system ATP-binding protein